MLLYEIKDFLFSLFFSTIFSVLQSLKLLRKVSVLSLIVLTIYPQDCPLEFYNKFTYTYSQRNKGIRQNCKNRKFIRTSKLIGFRKNRKGTVFARTFLDSENAARSLSGNSTNEVRRGEDKSYLYYPRRWLTLVSNKV